MDYCEICKDQIENEYDSAEMRSNKGNYKYHYDCYMEIMLDTMDNPINNEGE